MKIMFVVPGMGYGGAERVISILANQFVAGSDEVSILIIGDNNKVVYNMDSRVNIFYYYAITLKNIDTLLGVFRNIRKTAKELAPDVIISFINDICAVTVLALLGTKFPVIYSERNDPSRNLLGFKQKCYRFVVEKLANGFVFQSYGAQTMYKKCIQNKSVVIMNPLALKNISSRTNNTKLKEIVTVGRLTEQKNHKLLLDSFAKIASKNPEYLLKIYGDGPLKGYLTEYANNLGLNSKVFFMGNKKNVLDLIKDASLFVLSSDYEGIPNALIEAMALGLPCISTDCSPGGAAMLIKNGANGLLVPTNNVSDLSEAIDYLLKNKLVAENIGLEARNIVLLTDEKKILNQWREYINYVIAKR